MDSAAQAVIVCAYITMIFAQILALYWYANELKEQVKECISLPSPLNFDYYKNSVFYITISFNQNLSIAAAAYETEWFTFEIPVQKLILLMILRAQKPCTVSYFVQNFPVYVSHM